MSDDDSLTTAETIGEEASFDEGSVSSITETMDPCPPAPATLTAQQRKQNLAKMTIAHYVATYPRWSFSLFLRLATCTLLLPSAFESVRQPFKDLRAATAEESRRYYESTVNAFSHLREQLNVTVEFERQRTLEVDARNKDRILEAKHLTALVNDNTVTARRTLQVWQLQSPIPLVENNNNETTCSAQDRQLLSQMLGQDYSIVENTVTTAIDGYLGESCSVLQHVTEYAQERMAYDYDYFVGVKIQATLDILAGLDSPDIQLSFDQMQVIERLKEILQKIMESLHEAYIRVALLLERLREFFDSINGFYVNYLDIHARLRQASLFVKDFLPGDILFPDFLDISNLPTADILLPVTFEMPSFENPLPDLDTLIDDYIRDALELLIELVAELTEEAYEQTRKALEALIEKLREHLTLEDYDPPRYVSISPQSEEEDDLQTENNYLFEQGEAAKRAALKAIENDVDLNDHLDEAEVIIPEDSYQGSSFERDATIFEYFEPSFPSFSVPDFILMLGEFILGNQWIIEMVIQLIRFWRLRRKYERNGIPDLPEIEFGKSREENEQAQAQKPGTMALVQRTFFKHFATPWMALGLILFPLAILSVALWFPHVKGRCIDSREGTVFAHNMIAPVLINSANMDGYAFHARAEMQCRRSQQKQCSQLSVLSDQRYRAGIAELASAQTRFKDALRVSGLLQRCVQVDWMDASMNTNCCGLEGYELTGCDPEQDEPMCPIDPMTIPPSAFRPVGAHLFAPAFESGLESWELEDSRFNCDALADTCNTVPTDGVDNDLILSLVIDADCRAQTYVILWCIFILLALYYAVMWNMSCKLAFNGSKRLLWRRLQPDGIKLTTQVTEDGELVLGSDVSDRAERIAEAVRQYEMIGKLQIALGGLIFSIWLVSFFILGHRLAEFTDYV